MKVTLQQLAEMAGVSVATVSRVLNGNAAVAPETRKKVLQAAQTSGFSGGWKLSGRPLVALITNHWNNNNILPRLIQEVADELEKDNFQYEIIPLRHLVLLEDLPVSGIVSLATRDELPPEWRPEVPVVMLNAEENRAQNFYSVYSDISHGIELAIDHLYELGHRRVALATRGQTAYLEKRRQETFRTEVKRHRDLKGIISTEWEPLSGFLNEFARLRRRGVTGLLVPGYNNALAAFHALALLNWRVPDELSIVVQEERWVTRYLLPEPTEIQIDLSTVCGEAVRMLRTLLAGGTAPRTVLVPYRLVARDSTAPPPSGGAAGTPKA